MTPPASGPALPMHRDAPALPDGTPAPPSTIGDLAGQLRLQRPRLPLFVALLTLVAAFLRFGYVYGAGDQDELIPSLLHLLDGSLFAQDWLVQTVASGINVRTYFLWLTALPSLVLPVWLSVLLLWIGVFVALCFGVYGLAHELVRDRLAAALSVPVVLVLTVKWTLGANSLAYDALVPEGVAWALAVPAITLFLQRRWGWAGALLGVATWFHLLAGAQTALVLGAVGLGRAAMSADLEGQKWRADLLDLVRFGGTFVLAALPILVPVAVRTVRDEPDGRSRAAAVLHPRALPQPFPPPLLVVWGRGAPPILAARRARRRERRVAGEARGSFGTGDSSRRAACSSPSSSRSP